MRGCIGIKIFLVICPSSHRTEDLPSPEVFWNLRLSCMSFLPSSFLLSWFSACWASPHFYCSGFPLCSASTGWAFCRVGLLLCLAYTSLGPSQGCFSHFTSKSQPQVFLVECTISSVLSCCSKCLKWRSGVTLQSFIRQTKDSTLLRHKDVPSPKQEPQPVLAPSFCMYCLLPLNLHYAN